MNGRAGKLLSVSTQGWLGLTKASRPPQRRKNEPKKPPVKAKAKKGRSVRVEGSQVDQEGIRGPHQIEDHQKWPPSYKYLGHHSVLHISLARLLDSDKKPFLPSSPMLPYLSVPVSTCVPEGHTLCSCPAPLAKCLVWLQGGLLSSPCKPQGSSHLKMTLAESKMRQDVFLQCYHAINPSVDKSMQEHCPASAGTFRGAWLLGCSSKFLAEISSKRSFRLEMGVGGGGEEGRREA